MSWMQRKALLEKRADVQKQMKQILDGTSVTKDVKTETRDLTAEENGKFDELSKRSDELSGQIARFDRMIEIESEARSSQPQPGREGLEKPEPETRSDDAKEEQRAAAVDQFLRHGEASLTAEQRSLIVASKEETRALAISGFGVVGTRKMYGRLVESMKSFTGVIAAGAEVITTATGSQVTVPTADDTGNVGQLLGENTEETNMTDPTVGNVNLDGYKYSSKIIRLSVELLQDQEFDLEGAVFGMAGRRIGRILNTHTTTGDGTSKPRGFAVAATAASMEVETADNATPDYADLLDLINKVDAAYWSLPSSGFQMNQSVLIAARKMKDGEDRPIWTPAFGDVEERIHGKKVTINNDLASYGGATAAKVAAFGDWSNYKVRAVSNPVVLRLVERYAEFGQVGFLVLSRHDGDQTDSKSVAVLKLKAA